MLGPTDSAKGIFKRQHVMSQAWSQFASKDLGVPKGKIKKKNNMYVENKEIMHEAFYVLQGALPPATNCT